MSTPDQGRSPDDFPIDEIQQERKRLEQERKQLIDRRDRLYATVVDVADDTGFKLVRVLRKLKEVEERIEQWNNILRSKGITP